MTIAINNKPITEAFAVSTCAPKELEKAVELQATSAFMALAMREGSIGTIENAGVISLDALAKDFSRLAPENTIAIEQIAVWVSAAVSTQKVDADYVLLPLFTRFEVSLKDRVVRMAANPSLVEVYKKEMASAPSYRPANTPEH